MQESPYLDPAMVAIYDRIAAPFQFAAPASDLVKIARVPAGAVVLDVGAGTGLVAAAARAAVGVTGTVIATDGAFEMIRVGREGTCRIVAQVPLLPFPDETFDVVVAGFVVSHFESYLDGLREMIRVCRTGERIGVSAWGRHRIPQPHSGVTSPLSLRPASG